MPRLSPKLRIRTNSFVLVIAGCIVAPFSVPSKLSAEEINTDYQKPESPPLPIPKGMEWVDQGRLDPRLKGYRTPVGFKLEIVADAPTVINPVGMTFGPDGSLFVLEWSPDTGSSVETPEKIVYKDGSTRTIATMKKKVKDTVKVLTYNPEKGQYDTAKVILEDELPSSILIHDGWLYTSGRGTVRGWKLADIIEGNNRNAKPAIIAQGFCGYHHHQVSGLTIGNDGWLYITSGDNDNYVEGSDGSRATVLRTGAVFRCRPDGSKLHAFSIGYRNPYRDVACDERGNLFHLDNDNEDGSKFTGCRLMHVAEQSDFGWRLLTGANCCRPDPERAAVFGELPGKLPPMLKTGRGAPAGLLIYQDTQLPEFYRGWLYYPDVFRKLIRAYRVVPDGATFKTIHEFEFLRTDDPLFRPCQMVTGPDGAIYICDWRTDSGGAGRLSGDGLHGRIYRISWSGGAVPGLEEQLPAIALRSRDTWAKILKSSNDDLLKTIGTEEGTSRAVARHELVHRGEKNREALLNIIADKDAELLARINAIGVVQSFWNDEVRTAMLQAARDVEPDVRRLAVDALALYATPGDREIHAALLKLTGDSDLAVRRAIFLAIGKINADNAADVLTTAYLFDDGKDLYLVDGLLRAIERTGKPGILKLVEATRSGKAADAEKIVAAFSALRTRAAADAIPDVLTDPHLTLEQRIAVIHSYRNYQLDPPISWEPLIDYLSKPGETNVRVQLAALEVLAEAGNLKGAKVANLLTNLVDSPEASVRLFAIRMIEKAAVADAAPRLRQILMEATRDPGERLAIVSALRILKDQQAEPIVLELLQGDQPSNLRVEALRALAEIAPKSAMEQATKLLASEDSSVLREAIRVLGLRPEGAQSVGQAFVAKKLPREMLPEVSAVLRTHAAKNEELSKLLTAVMKGGLLVSNEPAEIVRVRQLVLTKGNAQRGRMLYLNSKQLACVSCHKLEGIGGQVGPDLTKLWETSTIEKIMESIIEPSKEIKEGYQTFRATTKNGQTYTGLKVIDQPAKIVLRDAQGKDTPIARGDLEDLVASSISLMPDNVVSQLSYDQFIDLVAFLKSRESQETLREIVPEFWVAGPYAGEFATAQPPETNADPDAKFADGSAWQRRAVDPNGMLDFRAVFGKESTSGYAMTFVYSPKPQKATLYLGADDRVRVWVGGTLIHQQLRMRTAVPESDRIQFDLKEGWNTVLIKVGSQSAGHGLYLRIQGSKLRFGLKHDG